MAEEEITRATAKKPSTTGRKTGTTTSSGRKTTSTSSSRRKTTSTSTARKKKTTTAKKPSTTAKKPAASSSIRLTRDEKALVTDFRKCNLIEKKLIKLLASKLSDSTTRSPEENDQLTGLLTRLTGQE
ncbi:MAG: hypothetical protein IKG46_08005 [Solobacterium sp.]|nr:hypothetical protein [Solobacterium sp.]